jgi:hypothetical protein
MPRRRICNEHDAANLLAECAAKAARGEMPAHQLHAVTSALSTYANLRKSLRHEELCREIREEIDQIFGDSRGAALHFRRKLTPPNR